MSSFFAIGIAQFPQDDHGNTNWPLATVCGWLCMSHVSQGRPTCTVCKFLCANRETVGISFAVSIPLLIVAFNINIFTTPWNLFRHIVVRNMALGALKPLRKVPSEGIRIRGYRWYIGILDTRNEYDTSMSLSSHYFKFKRWIEGIRWNITNRNVWDPTGYIKILRDFRAEEQANDTGRNFRGSLILSQNYRDFSTFMEFLSGTLGLEVAYKFLASETRLDEIVEPTKQHEGNPFEDGAIF
jgi:hypothetical protein